MYDNQPKDLLDWMGISKAPEWKVARLLGPLIAVGLALLIAGAYLAAFALVCRVVFNSGEATLGTGALIAALLGAPFVIWGTVLKHQTVRYQKEGHITDRITSAVELLGAEKTVKKIVDGKTQETTEPNIEVRIGAILSLERIAQDSTNHDKGRDHVRVMEILCAYIRENSNAREPVDFPLPKLEALAEKPSKYKIGSHLSWHIARYAPILLQQVQEVSNKLLSPNMSDWASQLPKPREDIQTVLDVLGRRTAAQRAVEAAWLNTTPLNKFITLEEPCPRLPGLFGESLSYEGQPNAFLTSVETWRIESSKYQGYRLDLSGANLQRANLSTNRPDGNTANFSRAVFNDARLEGAKMARGVFIDACFQNAMLSGIQAAGARFTIAVFESADLEGADLLDARLDWTALSQANLAGARLASTNLVGATIGRARLEGTTLAWARLDHARLEGTDFFGANLYCASLQSARFSETSRLDYTHFHCVPLRNIDLSSFNISPDISDIIASNFGDSSLILPEGIARPAHWPDWELPDTGDHAFHTEWHKWLADPDTYTPPPKPSPN